MVPRHCTLRVRRATPRWCRLLLAKQGVNVNQARHDGVTPLYMASQQGHAERG